MQEILTNKTVEKLKHDLVKEGMVTHEELNHAQEISQAQRINLAQALIKSGILSEEILLKFIETKLHIPYVNLDDYTLDEKLLNYINPSDAKKYRVIPLFKIEDVLTVAMCDPMDLFVINNLINADELKVEPIICSENSILKAINKYYYNQENILSFEEDEIIDWRNILNNENQDENHLKNIIETILRQAIQENVHELFFEHQSYGLNVIFRKNGGIDTKGEVPSLLIPLFISKLKSMSRLDPNESELPQLGKLVFKLNDIDYTTSVSAFPTINGERIFLKIYSPPKNLNELGLPFEKLEYLKQAIQNQGIVLVCGSGLSGKTHVIYSLLQELSNSSCNVMTIESIVKYDIENINQCEINENVGLNLDKAMRFIEFQAPDVVYFEGLNTKSGLEYFISLAIKNKLVITEFLADGMEDLRKRFSFKEFDILKKLITCLVFIHNPSSIEVFTKDELKKFI